MKLEPISMIIKYHGSLEIWQKSNKIQRHSRRHFPERQQHFLALIKAECDAWDPWRSVAMKCCCSTFIFLFPPKTLFLGPRIALKKVRSHHPLSLLPNVIMSLFMDYSTMDHDDGATLTSSNRSLQRRKARPVAALRLSGCSVLRDRHAIRDKIPNQRIQAWDLLMYEAY